MPWNDQSGQGPWGDRNNPSGPKNPWGQGPSGQGPRGPGPGQGPGRGGADLEERLKQLRERFGRSGGGDSSGGDFNLQGPGRAGLAVIAGLAVVGWFATGIYFVQEGERAAVLRFGKFDRETGPGPHLALPYPIEERIHVPVSRLNRIEVGAEERGGEAIGLMITGDQNIVDLHFAVNWRVGNVENFLFNLEEPSAAVGGVAESVVREVVGKRNLEGVLTVDRAEIENQAREQIQATLDRYRAGVLIENITLQKADPPASVLPAFRAVAAAEQEAQTKIQQATEHRNKIVPAARGEAARILQEAEAYKERVVREASGEAQRFNLVYDQYRRAPGVTRQRLFMETMERVYGDANKVIIDGKAGQMMVLPPELLRPRAPAQSQPPVAPAPPAQAQTSSRSMN